jgi:hypothetical protein
MRSVYMQYAVCVYVIQKHHQYLTLRIANPTIMPRVDSHQEPQLMRKEFVDNTARPEQVI